MTERHRFMTGFALLLCTAGVGLWQWSVLSGLQTTASSLSTSISNATVTTKALAEDYQGIKKDVDATRETMAQELAIVLPSSEDLTELTRLFDDYAVKNNFSTNPFFVSDLRYSTVEGSPSSENYTYVPVNVNITTTRKNLSKFLEMVENSGSLDAQTRLMSIDQLSVQYPDEYGGTYKVNADLNAYYTP